VAGAFAGSVLPVVAAMIAKEPDLLRRARLFAGSGAAALIGLFAGPALSGVVFGWMARMPGAEAMAGTTLLVALSTAAVVGLAALAAITLWLETPIRSNLPASAEAAVWRSARLRPLLIANFLVFFGLGALEVSIPLLGAERLALDARGLGILFAECSAAMIVVQAALFFFPLPGSVPPSWFIASGFALMAAGLGWLALASSFVATMAAVGLLAASSGYLLPFIAFCATLAGDGARGASLGALTAAGSLGQAAGSAAGGSLYGALSGDALWIVALAMLAGTAVLREPGSGHMPQSGRHHRLFGRGP
jgi:hypothetical protein